MSMIGKIFVSDVKHITSNIVSIIIVIGLTVIPGLFTWFNVAACWDPFANTRNLQFAIANEDDGYKGDLLPVRAGDLPRRTRLVLPGHDRVRGLLSPLCPPGAVPL